MSLASTCCSPPTEVQLRSPVLVTHGHGHVPQVQGLPPLPHPGAGASAARPGTQRTQTYSPPCNDTTIPRRPVPQIRGDNKASHIIPCFPAGLSTFPPFNYLILILRNLLTAQVRKPKPRATSKASEAELTTSDSDLSLHSSSLIHSHLVNKC